jgi:hypothetical protein
MVLRELERASRIELGGPSQDLFECLTLICLLRGGGGGIRARRRAGMPSHESNLRSPAKHEHSPATCFCRVLTATPENPMLSN